MNENATGRMERFTLFAALSAVRDAQDELAFGDHGPVHSRVHFELQQYFGRPDRLRSQLDLFARPDRLQKFHRSDCGKEKYWPLRFRKPGRSSDSRCLSERFRNNHARNNWIAGKVAREHRIVRQERSPGRDGTARVAADNLADKNKRRPMRQAQRRR